MNATQASTHSDTKAVLIQASLKVFAQKGYDGATVKDIAEAAKVNVSLISYHFGGKENLFRACLQGIAEERLQAAERILQPCKDKDEFRVRLRIFAEDFIMGHLDNPDALTIIHRDFDMGQPIVIEIFTNVFSRMMELFTAFFKSAIKHSALRPDLDIQIVTSLIMGGLVHTIRTDTVRKCCTKVSIHDKKFRDKFLDQYITVFCHGLLREET